MAAYHMKRLLLLLSTISICLAQQPKRRFEYKHSFKGPHLMQQDGTVPFWKYGGSAFASDDQVRITPSMRSKRGFIWNRYVIPFDHWEVEFYFKVTGRGRVGADGLAFWYTDKIGEEGNVFGSQDKWNGLGVFFDSFDNDNLRNNPYIMAMVNDGTIPYQHSTDGMNQQLGGCLRDFRNKPYPVRAKIEYYKKTLTIYIHNGWTNIDSNYELCLRREDVTLPKRGLFGLTAATGGLADDHDVIKFLVHSLTPPNEEESGKDQFISQDEEERFKKEWDDYYEKLQQQKQEFKEKHPEKVKEEVGEDKFFEDTETRELRQIYEVQSVISKAIGELNKKLDEIVGRQERTLSAISAVQSSNRGGAGPPSGTGGQQQQPMIQAASEIKRHEVDTILNTQQELQRSIRDVRTVIGDVQMKTSSIQGKVDSKPSSQGNAGSNQLLTHELQDKLKTLSGDVGKLLQKSSMPLQCPEQEMPSCLTPAYFFLLLVLQGGIFFLYAMYRSKQDAAAKKFY